MGSSARQLDGHAQYCLTTSKALYVLYVLCGNHLSSRCYARARARARARATSYIHTRWLLRGEGRAESVAAARISEGGLRTSERRGAENNRYDRAMPSPTELATTTEGQQASECTYRTLPFGTSDSLFTFAQLQVMGVTGNGLQPLIAALEAHTAQWCVVSTKQPPWLLASGIDWRVKRRENTLGMLGISN
jgi:hypothetical protein